MINPLNANLEKFWKTKILEKFPEIQSGNNDYFSLYKYIVNPPKKYFSVLAYETFLLELERYFTEHPI